LLVGRGRINEDLQQPLYRHHRAAASGDVLRRRISGE
jgi:hypothetical protein